MSLYEETLRADRAERALRDTEQKLARVLEIADSLEDQWGENGVKASVVAATLRRAIRGLEYAP